MSAVYGGFQKTALAPSKGGIVRLLKPSNNPIVSLKEALNEFTLGERAIEEVELPGERRPIIFMGKDARLPA